MAVLGRSRSGAPPDQILDPPLKSQVKLGETLQNHCSMYCSHKTHIE